MSMGKITDILRLATTGRRAFPYSAAAKNLSSREGRHLGDRASTRSASAFRNRNRGRMAWEDRRLLWAAREPFVSRTTKAPLVMGSLAYGDDLVVESLIPAGGVILSDGVESDFLEFNAGSIARIATAAPRVRLVVGWSNYHLMMQPQNDLRRRLAIGDISFEAESLRN